VIPVLGVDTVQAARLPLHHRDPFDRMLVAQARRLGATLVSRDTVFDAYSGVERLAA
jgi:PIN domain nuclease of toxin-antitoxin system